MGNCVIYGVRLQGDERIRYVGQTKRGLVRREAEHRRSRNYPQYQNYPFYRWLAKHADDGVEFILIEDLGDDPSDLDVRERYWIAELGTFQNGGLNCDSGGLAGKRPKAHTPEARVKMSVAHKGRKFTEEHRKNLSIALSGERNPNWGATHSEERRAKTSAQSRGEGNPRALLNEVQVLEIIEAGKRGESTRSIADRHQTGLHNVRNILNNKTWKHLPRG